MKGKTIIIWPALSFALPAFAGYFQPHALMTPAKVSVENGRTLSDQTLNYVYNLTKTIGHVANTQFAQDGGMAGCGMDTNLLKRVYGENDYAAKNYIALNVFSRLMGFDNGAPFWSAAEGKLKGYESFPSKTTTSYAYPKMQYHRIIPNMYPAYVGLYNNAYNCGRFVQVAFSSTVCGDETKDGISKYCKNQPPNSYNDSTPYYGYVFDSCEDNNGWCRDDSAHIDINQATVNNNYYLSWAFTTNPHYGSSEKNLALKDVWLAWFGAASNTWSYIAVVNLENGISKLQYNVGSAASPVWVNSHYLAGSNNIGWKDSSSNGQLWQVEPMNSITDSQPSANPEYQIRIFDVQGYPFHNGSSYRFHLKGTELGEPVGPNFTLFYAGNYTQGKPAPSLHNGPQVIRTDATTGTGQVTVNFGDQLPHPITAAMMKPILMSKAGYSYPGSCKGNTCIFSQLPNESFTLLADYSKGDSNDITLQRVRNIHVEKSKLSSNPTPYILVPADINLSSTYTGAINVGLWISSSTSTTALSNNFIAEIYFQPAKTTDGITASTQGCWLNSYLNSSGKNNTTCYVYFTENNQSVANFTDPSYSPTATFDVVMLPMIGADSKSGYTLAADANIDTAVTVNAYAYNPADKQPYKPASLKNPVHYNKTSSESRSLMVLIDPNSDPMCLSSFSTVSVAVGDNKVNFTKGEIDTLKEVQISATSPVKASVTSSSSTICYATLSSPSSGDITKGSVSPGQDTVEMIKLIASPIPGRGINVSSSGDSRCVPNVGSGGSDTLTIGKTTKTYKVSAAQTQLDLSTLGIGKYTISDSGFTVKDGGQCKLTAPVSFSLNNGFTKVNLKYSYQAATCTALQVVSHTTWNTTQFELKVTDLFIPNNKNTPISGTITANSVFSQKIWGDFAITTLNPTSGGKGYDYTGSVGGQTFTFNGYVNDINGKEVPNPIATLTVNGKTCTIKTS